MNLFAELPTAFPKLQAVVQTMDAVAVLSPPPMQAIGQRLRMAFERERPDHYRGVSISELRKLPFAYWLPPAPSLPLTDPDLVQRYWAEALPQAIQSGHRREKRWLLPLFFAYCESFDTGDQWFFDFAKRVSIAVGRSNGAFAAKLADMQRDVAFFQPNLVGPRLANALLANPRRLDDSFADYLLWPGFVPHTARARRSRGRYGARRRTVEGMVGHRAAAGLGETFGIAGPEVAPPDRVC